jgi:hypothetical protein
MSRIYPSDAIRFTASPSSKKRAISLLANDHSLRQHIQPSPKKRKIPALKFTALAPPVQTKKATDVPQPQTSPIEDANELLSMSVAGPPTSANNSNKVALQAGPSRLYLEVKERVAQHSSTKGRGKVIKLNTKNVNKIAVQPSEPSIIDISSSPPPPPSDRTSSHAPLPSTAIKSTPANRLITKDDKSKHKPIKGKKEKPPTMTPVEYALQLREKATLAPKDISKKKSINKFLQGLNIFYAGGDMKFASEQTRGRMRFVCSLIISEAIIDHD